MSSTEIKSTPLHETISWGEASKLAKQVSGEDAQLVRYQLRPYSDDQIGCLGAHRQLLLEIKPNKSSSGEQHSFFVKTIPYENPNEAAYIKEKYVFEQETTFFRDVVPELMKHVDNGSWAPKCFLAKNDTLVFEDLSTRGYSMRGCVFDEETMMAALRTVARLHASSILAEARLEKSLFELYPKAFRGMPFVAHGKNSVWFLCALDATIAVADSLSLNSSKVSAVYERLIQQRVTEERENPSKNQNKWKVASHGDLWANNMMFNNQQPPHCMLVDFQFARYASLAQDVVLLLHLCTDRKFRKEYEQKMIEFYHSTLRTFVYKYNPAARVLSIDQLRHEIEEQRLRAVVIATVYLPSGLISSRFAADVLDDPVEYDKFDEYDNYRPKVLEYMKRDQTYRQRVEDCVRELVDYSERHF